MVALERLPLSEGVLILNTTFKKAECALRNSLSVKQHGIFGIPFPACKLK
jgi:hypothetical protein